MAENPSTEELLRRAREKAGSKPGSTANLLAAAKSAGSGSSTADLLAAAKKPAAAGGGTASILAAARAGAPAAKPAETPSVAEMLQKVRQAAETPEGKVATIAAEAPAKPKLPAKKPAKAKSKDKKGDVSRRGMIAAIFSPFVIAWTAMGAASGVFGLAVARFMMPNVLVEPPTKFKIGPPSDFPPEAVVTKFKAQRGIWVVNTSSYNGNPMIYALASVCTHLGCTPSWLEGEQKYKCPCHGSGFYKNGVNFEGPAPRPLERVGLRLAEDGMLEVDKGLKFQEEMGQWEDPASFHALA